jgi:hypothetical protein
MPGKQNVGGYAAAVLAAFGAGLVIMLATAPVPAHAETLTAFNRDRVLTPAELDRLRGGFLLPNGGFIQFGFQTQQYVNGNLVNKAQLTPLTLLANGAVTNSFTVSHTTYDSSGKPTTVTQPVGPNGFNFPVTVNNGQTTLSIASTGGGSVQSVIQNSANSQTVQSVTSIDVTTQGVLPSVQTLYTTAQVANAIQANLWLRR